KKYAVTQEIQLQINGNTHNSILHYHLEVYINNNHVYWDLIPKIQKYELKEMEYFLLKTNTPLESLHFSLDLASKDIKMVVNHKEVRKKWQALQKKLEEENPSPQYHLLLQKIAEKYTYKEELAAALDCELIWCFFKRSFLNDTLIYYAECKGTLLAKGILGAIPLTLKHYSTLGMVGELLKLQRKATINKTNIEASVYSTYFNSILQQPFQEDALEAQLEETTILHPKTAWIESGTSKLEISHPQFRKTIIIDFKSI
ncbi:MAG: hypothetical protein OIF50_09885, partial [Flavobacteriaceae bacterium]|nr:hypothetical protein [Flavobacteriaceae bacterium]